MPLNRSITGYTKVYAIYDPHKLQSLIIFAPMGSYKHSVGSTKTSLEESIEGEFIQRNPSFGSGQLFNLR